MRRVAAFVALLATAVPAAAARAQDDGPRVYQLVPVVQRSDGGPDGWFFRTALVAPL